MKKSILFLLVVLFAGTPMAKAMKSVEEYQSDSSDSSSDESEGCSVFTEARTNAYRQDAVKPADEDQDVRSRVFYQDDSDGDKKEADELDQNADDEAGNGAHWSDGDDLGLGDDEKDEIPDRKGNYFDLEEGKEKLEQCYLILHHVLPQLLGQAQALGIPVEQFENIIGEDLEDIDPKQIAKFLKKCHRKLQKEFGNKIFSKLKKRPKKGNTRANIDVEKIVKITEEIIDNFIHVYTKIKSAKKGQKRSMVTEANVQVLANFSLVLLDVFKKGLEIKMNDTTLTDEERGIFKRWYNKILVAGVLVATGLGVSGMMGWCSITASIPLISQYLPEAMTCAVAGT